MPAWLRDDVARGRFRVYSFTNPNQLDFRLERGVELLSKRGKLLELCDIRLALSLATVGSKQQSRLRVGTLGSVYHDVYLHYGPPRDLNWAAPLRAAAWLIDGQGAPPAEALAGGGDAARALGGDASAQIAADWLEAHGGELRVAGVAHARALRTSPRLGWLARVAPPDVAPPKDLAFKAPGDVRVAARRADGATLLLVKAAMPPRKSPPKAAR